MMMEQTKKVLVTGITGNVGSEVARFLKEADYPFKAGVRNIEKAKKALGEDLDYVTFDLEDESTFEEALKDVDKVFLIRPPAISDPEKMVPFINKTQEMKIEQLVFLSLMGIERNPIPPHYKIEKYILKSGIPYTFLRPSFFMQNLDTTHRDDIKERNEIFIPAGNAKVSFIDARDIGAVGAKTLIEKGHENKSYTLTGSEALDYYEVAKIFSKVLGREIKYTNPPSLKFRKVMIERGVPKEFANVMVGLYFSTKMGMGKKVTAELETLLGRKAISVEQYVKDYVSLWQ